MLCTGERMRKIAKVESSIYDFHAALRLALTSLVMLSGSQIRCTSALTHQTVTVNQWVGRAAQ